MGRREAFSQQVKSPVRRVQGALVKLASIREETKQLTYGVCASVVLQCHYYTHETTDLCNCGEVAFTDFIKADSEDVYCKPSRCSDTKQ